MPKILLYGLTVNSRKKYIFENNIFSLQEKCLRILNQNSNSWHILRLLSHIKLIIYYYLLPTWILNDEL